MAEIYTFSENDEDSGWYSNEAATFGDRVAAGREAIGLTQEALAKRLGIKLKTVQNWENDLSEPRANKLQMLSGILNVSLPWLLMGEGDVQMVGGDVEMRNGVVAEDGFFEDELVSVEGEDLPSSKDVNVAILIEVSYIQR